MNTWKPNKEFFIANGVVVGIGIIAFSIFTYMGSSGATIKSLLTGISIFFAAWFVFSFLKYQTARIKIENNTLIYLPGLGLSKEIPIGNILSIHHASKLKPFDTIYETLSLIHENSGQEKTTQISLNIFASTSIGEVIKELLKINPNITLDDYSESLINGEFLKKESAAIVAHKQKFRSEWKLGRLLKTAIITALIGITIIAIFVIYIIYSQR